MPARARDLFEAIASFPALRAAALRAAKGKRSKPGVAAFLANLETEVLRLERELATGRYRPGRYTVIEVFDPKHRLVSAAPFRDRVVHHAFCKVCEPIFECGFIHDSYANRVAKGTHRAVARYEVSRPLPVRAPLRHLPLLPSHRPRDPEARPAAASRLPPHPGAGRYDHRRCEPAGAGEPLLSGRRPVHALRASARAAESATSRASSSPTCTWTGSTTSARNCCGRRATSATWTTSSCLPTTRGDSSTGGGGSTATSKAVAFGSIRVRRTSARRALRRAFSATSSSPVAGVGCRRTTCAASGTASAASGTAGGRARRRAPRSNNAFSHGSRTRTMQIRGACATRSSGRAGSIPHGSLATPLPSGPPRRCLEQQSDEPPLREPEQEHHVQGWP